MIFIVNGQWVRYPSSLTAYGSRKGLSVVDIAAVPVRTVQEQKKTLAAQRKYFEERLKEQQQEINEMKAMLGIR